MPYDHKNTTPDGLPSHQMRSLLEELNEVHCHKRCMVGSGGGSVGYVLLYLKAMITCGIILFMLNIKYIFIVLLELER